MNLLSILETNGTGLLEGLCRPYSRDISFSRLKLFNKAKVDFSLGPENLGTYEVQVKGFSDPIKRGTDETVLSCVITETEKEGIGVLLRIIINDAAGDFGRFEAFDYR